MAYYTDEQLQTIRKGLEFAKQNPNDPKSKEIINRLKSGKLNYELKALGLKPVDAPKPKPDLSKLPMSTTPVQSVPEGGIDMDLSKSRVSMQLEKPGQLRGIAQDVGSDFREMGQNIVEGFKQRTTETGDNIARRRETDKGFLGELGEAIGTGLDIATDTLVTAADAVIQGGAFAAKQFTTDEQEKAIADTAQRVTGRIVENARENPATKPIIEESEKIVAAYNQWAEQNPEQAGAVENVTDIAQILGELFVTRGGLSVSKEAIDVASDTIQKTAPQVREAAQAGQEMLETGARRVGEQIDNYSAKRQEVRLADQQNKVKDVVGRITQAGDDPRAIQQATRALSDIDTSDVRTYTDLNTKLDDRITALSREVDTELETVSQKFGSNDLVKTTQVGDELVTETPVKSALDGLEEAYTKSGEAAQAARIRQLRQRFESEGLTLREVNDLAREYGIEFRDRAFTKLGDAKAGYNAENYENIRTSLKEIVREKMPNETTKELDRKMSDIYTTRDLTRKVSDRIAKLEQRIKNRTLAQKVGGTLAQVADLTTGGMLRGFVAKILPSNMGNKAMNSIEIQEELRRNLREIDKMLEMQNDDTFADAFENWAKNLQPGMSIKPINPDDNQFFLKISDANHKMTDREFEIASETLQSYGLIAPSTKAKMKSYLEDVTQSQQDMKMDAALQGSTNQTPI